MSPLIWPPVPTSGFGTATVRFGFSDHPEFGQSLAFQDLTYNFVRAIQRAIGDRRGLVPTLHNLAHLALKLGNERKAMESWSEALQLATQTGDAKGIFHVARDMGLLLVQIGQKDKARRLFKLAATTGERAGFPDAPQVRALADLR